jgi:hypothetical protein
MKSANLEPFHDPLIESDLGRDLRTLKDLPEHVARIEDNVTSSTSLESLKLVSSLLGDLDKDYGIKNPGYSPVTAGSDSENTQSYVVTRRVHGTNLVDAISKGDPEVLSQTAQLYDGLVRYMGDKSKDGTQFMSDIFGNRQYMFGHIDGDPNDRIYLTDIAFHVSSVENELTEGFMITRAVDLFQEIMGVSLATSEKFTALGSLVNLINSMPHNNRVLDKMIKSTNQAFEEDRQIPEAELENLSNEFMGFTS